MTNQLVRSLIDESHIRTERPYNLRLAEEIGHMDIPSKNRRLNYLLVPTVIILAIVLSPLILLVLLWPFLVGVRLNIRFRKKWGSQNKYILYVYSESPNWQQYIENNILPVINKRAVLLNWSKRSEWKNKTPLEAKIMFHWGDGKEFNPMAIIFAPKGKVKVIRFHQAFIDLKHGNDVLLKEKETELYGYL